VTAKLIVPRELANHDIDEAVAYHLREANDEVPLGFVDALETAYRHTSVGTRQSSV
jgi:toxin ParE1/3/4